MSRWKVGGLRKVDLHGRGPRASKLTPLDSILHGVLGLGILSSLKAVVLDTKLASRKGCSDVISFKCLKRSMQ